MTELQEKITREFRARFNHEPFLFAAPGRINLIGEHVDYNDGFVLPAAIDKHLLFAIAPNGGDRSTIYSADVDEVVSFSTKDLSAGSHWVNYLMGVVAGFQKRNCVVGGIDCVFGGTIPAGAGLSSSAALCCGFGLALNEFAKADLSRLDLARIAQYSEHQFAGVMCGLMDQYAVLFGEQDSLLLLDCRSMSHRAISLPQAAGSIILVDTQVKHALASSSYNERRSACEEGTTILKRLIPTVRSLRDVTLELLDKHREQLTPDVMMKCRFIVKEITRTVAAAMAVENGDWMALGSLMYESHEGLRSEYQVSCEELDFLVSVSKKNPALVTGSRLMGGGFGGCTINLVKPGQEHKFHELISKEYFAFFKKHPVFYPVTLSTGAHRITQ